MDRNGFKANKGYGEENGDGSRYSSRIMFRGGIFVRNSSNLPTPDTRWSELPYDVLLEIFLRLRLKDVGAMLCCCRNWSEFGKDDYFWKKYCQKTYRLEKDIPLSPYAVGGWMGEMRRLAEDCPVWQCEVSRVHRARVMHVQFSGDGSMFATCGNDAKVMVWSSDYPVSILFERDLHKRFGWKFAFYSQFNSSDSMLMVSGAYKQLGPYVDAGELVVFDLDNDFRMLSRTKNKPYDLLGGWITDEHFIAGELTWLRNRVSANTLLLIRATQCTSSEHVPVFMPLFKIYNINCMCARSLLVAVAGPDYCQQEAIVLDEEEQIECHDDSMHYNREYYLNPQWHSEIVTDFEEDAEEREKLILYTTGTADCTHQIGIIRWQPVIPERLNVEHDIAVLIRRREERRVQLNARPEIEMDDYDRVRDICRKPDHLIDVRANIMGLALSPDHRYLYVCTVPWLDHGMTSNPEVLVVDLQTLQVVGRQSTPKADECEDDEEFFVFPSASQQYFVSVAGSSASLYDRHYGARLAELQSNDAVNCAALSPRGDVCITVADDASIRVWRSRREASQLCPIRSRQAKMLHDSISSR